MTLENTELIINGEKVLVTNLEISYDGPGFQNNEMSVRVEGRIPQKFDEEGCWWGVDMARGSSESITITTTPDGENYFKDLFLKSKLDGTWEYATKKEEEMRNRCDEDKACSEDSSYYAGTELAQDLKDLDLDDEQKLLLEYGLVNRSGLVTNKGKEVLLNLLFDKNRSDIVKKLQALEEAEEDE